MLHKARYLLWVIEKYFVDDIKCKFAQLKKVCRDGIVVHVDLLMPSGLEGLDDSCCDLMFA